MLAGMLFLLLARFYQNNRTRNIINESQSSFESQFSTAVSEAQKKAEEERLKEEERKRQEEETKRFIATYGPCRMIPILMYHHIDDKSGSLYVSKKTFAGQLDYLVQKGYQTVSLNEVIESLQGLKTLPSKPVVITFDDGYRDVYLNAYPLLLQRNMKATFFIITQLVDGGEYMTWEQLREMAGNSLVTIGDHTLSHKAAAMETDDQLKNEIMGAKNILEERLGVKVNTFAYPYGSMSTSAEKILKEGGFAAAVTTQRGLSCAKLPYDLPRIRIGNAALSSYGF